MHYSVGGQGRGHLSKNPVFFCTVPYCVPVVQVQKWGNHPWHLPSSDEYPHWLSLNPPFWQKKSLPFFCLVYLKQLAVGHIYKTIFNFIRIFIDIKLYSLIFCRCHIFSINIPQSLIWSHQWWLAAWICAKEPARIQPLSKLDWQRPNAMHIKYFEAWLWSMFLQILKQLIQQKVIHIGIISISKQKNK